MQLEFAYRNDRPMLTAKLREVENRARYFEFLIDSGADYTLIPKSDALILGIDYKTLKVKEIKVEIANLTFIHAKKTNINITINGKEFVIPILIAKEGVERLLGRKGVFEEYEITFKEKKGIVVLKENN